MANDGTASGNVAVASNGSNNNTHVGNNNSNNNGIIGNGSNNVVNSGNNSGHHMFSNASYFNISGGEFINSGGSTTKNIYNNYGGTRHYNQNIGTIYGNANQGENQKNDGSTYNNSDSKR
ncbi:hypothetical protein M378DRAFT_154645 [Amanita muscaria Koide BX008]|uniref:Uncharacterized protein n=1 Tax=Amanita muscaria (strain Koide BX008) TaxID=946122 RepID=A0A0C2X9V7_AMAMK|nr:hypothetical protein M378DRAFT_154645 [Amanita muscaria Koide BX008]